ncbi:MAG TPA: hypothetical protein VFI54_07965 [Solirubrobacteraceae bacterium]|nr:hypothetical protein [Solirubrobacteraceae bacterium]
MIAGFRTPGRAQVNSPAFDWAWLAAGAHYNYTRHKRSFTVVDYDGNSSGYGKIFDFSCRTGGALIQCTNAFGDSMRYRP